MEKLRILYATMEIDPFLRISEAASFIRQLPQGLQEKGHEIRILMPKFGVINERRNRLHEVVRLSGINIRVGTEEKPLTIKVATIQNTRLQVYFLDNEDYFTRKSVLNDPSNEEFHFDNDERSIFFCKGVIETVKKLGWSPHIIHCHGWMTALIPLYLKTYLREDQFFKHTKVVYTVYQNEVDHPLPTNFAQKMSIENSSIPQNDYINQFAATSYKDFSRGGIQTADVVTKADPQIKLSSVYEIGEEWEEVSYDLNGTDSQQYVNYYDNLYREILG
jgi:starch synthase